MSLFHVIESPDELFELAGATDHRRREPVRSKPACRLRLSQCAKQAMDTYLLSLAFQRQFASPFEGEEMKYVGVAPGGAGPIIGVLRDCSSGRERVGGNNF